MAGSYLRQMDPLADRLKFTALVDLDIERARRGAEAAKVGEGAHLATDYHEGFDDVDGVVIALPHDLHHRVALDFLERGKHVLLEKPMAITEQQCLDLVKAADESDGILMIGYVMRFHPLWMEMSRLIHDKVYGDTFHVSVWTEQYTHLPYSAWSPQMLKIGGGQLFSHGCHYIDLLLHWMGRPVEGMHIGTNYGTPWMDMEGTSNVVLKFENGALGYHFGTWGARGTQLGYSVHTHCTEGMLELAHAAQTITLCRTPGRGDLPALESSLPPGAKLEGPDRAVIYSTPASRSKSTHAEVEHLLDCIETGLEPVTNARMATQGLRVIWRLYVAEQQKTLADLRGLGLDEFQSEPDPFLAEYEWAM